MLIEIHAIQNHSPANLNRDDLGAPEDLLLWRRAAVAHFQPVHQAKHSHER